MNKIEQQVWNILWDYLQGDIEHIYEEIKPFLRREPTPVEIAAQELADDVTFGEIARLKSELETYKRRDKIIAFTSALSRELIA